MAKEDRVIAQWSGEAAATWLERSRGLEPHYRKSKSSNYRVPGALPREISVSLGRARVVSAYVNARSAAGAPFPSEGIRGIEIARSYDTGHRGENKSRGIAESVARANPTLDPRGNDVLLVHIRDPESLERLYDWYAGKVGSAVPPGDPSPPHADDEPAPMLTPGGTSLEEFLRGQERRSAIGEAGELIALKHELNRLRRECGCSKPDAFVKRVSLEDVGLGYDIESNWPGHERKIEVKSSTQGTDGFFISEREKTVLGHLGEGAWLYLVELNADLEGSVVRAIRDPMKALAAARFVPIAWRVILSSP